MKQASATTSVSPMKSMRFHRNARISPIRRPVMVASTAIAQIADASSPARLLQSQV
jgi:hypothetical protein